MKRRSQMSTSCVGKEAHHREANDLLHLCHELTCHLIRMKGWRAGGLVGGQRQQKKDRGRKGKIHLT